MCHQERPPGGGDSFLKAFLVAVRYQSCYPMCQLCVFFFTPSLVQFNYCHLWDIHYAADPVMSLTNSELLRESAFFISYVLTQYI